MVCHSFFIDLKLLNNNNFLEMFVACVLLGKSNVICRV